MNDIYKSIAKKTWIWPLYIRWYLENENFELFKNMYNKFQYIMWAQEYDKKNINDFIENFNNLIDDFKENWFNEKYPIIVSKELIPIDWHHRTACCLYFNIIPKYTIDESISIKEYNWLNWILNNSLLSKSFSTYEKLYIIKEYNRYNRIWILLNNTTKDKEIKNNLKKENIEILWTLRVNLKKNEKIVKGIKLKAVNKSNYIDVIIVNKERKESILQRDFHAFYSKDIEKIILNPELLKSNLKKENKIFRKILITILHNKNKIKRKIFEYIKSINYNNQEKW
jgi:hypothetical protein